MLQDQARRDVGGKASEVVTHALPQRLERLEPGAVGRRMDADGLGGAVIDGGEDHDLAVAKRHRSRRVVPHIMFGQAVTIVPVCAPGYCRIRVNSQGREPTTSSVRLTYP